MREPKESYIFAIVLFLSLVIGLLGISVWSGIEIMKAILA